VRRSRIQQRSLVRGKSVKRRPVVLPRSCPASARAQAQDPTRAHVDGVMQMISMGDNPESALRTWTATVSFRVVRDEQEQEANSSEQQRQAIPTSACRSLRPERVGVVGPTA
jgi:hypothetical protein